MAGCIFYQANRIVKLTDENEFLENDKTALLEKATLYKVNDSLNAIETNALRLSIKDLERYRKEDLALINNLNIKGRDIENMISTQLRSFYKINSKIRDSIIYIGENPSEESKTIKCFAERTKWFDVEGCLDDQVFTGSIATRDSLIYVETIKRKRFLGFLWKTKKILNRKQDIISKNPYTIISDAEFITIEN